MNYPIIVCEGLDVQFFDSKSSAEMEIEPTDVKNSTYKIFDSKGTVLRLGICKRYMEKKWWQFWMPEETESVRIEAFDYENIKDKELYSILIHFYEEMSIEFNETMNLEELISIGKRYFAKGHR